MMCNLRKLRVKFQHPSLADSAHREILRSGVSVVKCLSATTAQTNHIRPVNTDNGSTPSSHTEISFTTAVCRLGRLEICDDGPMAEPTCASAHRALAPWGSGCAAKPDFGKATRRR
jgi:hypothetical protein